MVETTEKQGLQLCQNVPEPPVKSRNLSYLFEAYQLLWLLANTLGPDAAQTGFIMLLLGPVVHPTKQTSSWLLLKLLGHPKRMISSAGLIKVALRLLLQVFRILLVRVLCCGTADETHFEDSHLAHHETQLP